MRGVFVWSFVSVMGMWGALAACSKPAPPPVEAGADDAAVDVDAAPEAAVAVEAGKGSLVKLGATAQTSILDQPSWPESGKGGRRLGYLRHGAIVMAYDHAVANDDCKDGWYELEVGGYVCGKAVTTELTSAKVRLAPKQPDHDAGMPYRYGVNLQDGTPLYRRVLATDDRKKYEPWLVPPKASAEEPVAATDPVDKADKADKIDKTEAPEGDEAPRASTHGKTDKTDKTGDKIADAGVDASKPKLKSLKGRGVLVRTMARGFYLALDRSFTSNGARWWRTSFGFAVPFDRILLQPGVTKYSGTWFSAIPTGATGGDALHDGGGEGGGDDDGEASVTMVHDTADAAAGPAGTVAFVNVGFARKLELSEDDKKLTWGAELPKRTPVLLDGRIASVSGVTYHHTTSGFWVRMMDVTVAHPAPPADLQADEKWIDVDLTRQTLVAFEGSRPVFGTLISSGRRNPQDKEHDFPTVVGSFRIKEKHVTTTMDGDIAADGPYSIEDVPWVMYFQGSYALHAAFWHDGFGNKRSHGCVNMAPEDARTLFAWTDPPLPPGWHGVFAKDEASGTRVIVHEDSTKR